MDIEKTRCKNGVAEIDHGSSRREGLGGARSNFSDEPVLNDEHGIGDFFGGSVETASSECGLHEGGVEEIS
jgi:hypothetical protein